MAAAAALRGGGRAVGREVLQLEARGLCTKPVGTGTAPPPPPKKPAQPAPEELDNSTYKNLQHHDYHTFTFHDYVAILAKYRQPQPSSGRPSPRH
ncbi:NADH dehydrogenase [ubiquinone] flavoprotein 3, mitochondrial isoform X2 [Molothrus ater]|uniref:NADH dehydrogenase [ubiquinone] flavoprotein 3, mitochondrial isoform X2 n=1 Tax=Molothrus ater TaxID=84834 RepID=UPI001749E7DF|nr:NADH dehydrogenase [ubiquinone] flavoprotein 3, mitochondrial isoform X2 [Molothrus ater]